MGYFQVRYDYRVVNYYRRGFIRLATGQMIFLKFLLIYSYFNPKGFATIRWPIIKQNDYNNCNQCV